MTTQEASLVSSLASRGNIIETLFRARGEITDWTVASKVNIGISLGMTYNIYIKALRSGPVSLNVYKNILTDFGDYYPGGCNFGSKIEVGHQDPIDVDWHLLTDKFPKSIRIR